MDQLQILPRVANEVMIKTNKVELVVRAVNDNLELKTSGQVIYPCNDSLLDKKRVKIIRD